MAWTLFEAQDSVQSRPRLARRSLTKSSQGQARQQWDGIALHQFAQPRLTRLASIAAAGRSGSCGSFGDHAHDTGQLSPAAVGSENVPGCCSCRLCTRSTVTIRSWILRSSLVQGGEAPLQDWHCAATGNANHWWRGRWSSGRLSLGQAARLRDVGTRRLSAVQSGIPLFRLRYALPSRPNRSGTG